MSSSPLKSLKSTASTTATPRILEEDKEAGRENSTILESQSSWGDGAFSERVGFLAKKPCRDEQLLESTFEKSHDAGGNASPSSLRAAAEAVARQSIKESTFSKTDSRNTRNTYSAAAECMDCHAVATAPTRNDEERAALAGNDRKNATFQNEDSRENAQNRESPESAFEHASNVSDSQAVGFLMKKRGCAAFCAEIRLECLFHKQKANSPLFRKKPTPKPSKAQSTSQNEDSSPALQGLYAIGGISLETLPLLHHLPISGVCMRQALMQTPNPQDFIHRCRLTQSY